MFEQDENKLLLSESEIREAISESDLTEEELQEIQMTLDVLAEILYSNI